MSLFKRYERPLLIALAIFCLVIFSVTGAMTMAFGSFFGGGPDLVATYTLPRAGETELTWERYQSTANLMGVFMPSDDLETEDIIRFAVLEDLANDMNMTVSSDQLAVYLQYSFGIQTQEDYRRMLARFPGVSTPKQFEGLIRRVLTTMMVESLLSSSEMPTSAEALEQWSVDYQEYRLEYVRFRADDYVDQAEREPVDEEDLTDFFENRMSQTQTEQLKEEDAIAFDALLLEADALSSSEAVVAWANQEAPSEEELRGFYEYRRGFRYLRDDGQATGEDRYLTIEELGDRLEDDFLLHRAGQQLASALTDVTDLADFAMERGVELVQFAEPVSRSALAELDRVGNYDLQDLFQYADGDWMQRALLLDSAVVVARPTARRERRLPELAAIRDQVLAHYREERSLKLAEQDAERFAERILPPAEAADTGVTVDALAAAASGVGLQVDTLDWISAQPRPAVDPHWPVTERFLPWLRRQLLTEIAGMGEGDLFGPLSLPVERLFAVGRVAGTRAPDVERIWPGELQRARMTMASESTRAFGEEQLSYESLASRFQIERPQSEDAEESEDGLAGDAGAQ